MQITLNCIIFLTLCQYVMGYASQITTSSATTSTISNFYQDFSACSCDKTPSLCDNYCCCDSACPSATVSAWTSAYSCLTTSSPIQYLCNQTSNSGYGSFNDLSCVQFTNRGSIGYFYQNMQAATLTYPTVDKFSSIIPSVISQSFQSAVSSAGLVSGYTAKNQYLLTSASTYFLAPQPGPGGFCIAGILNATTSKSSNCYVTATASNCASLNNNYAATLCLKGDCSSSSTSITVTAPSAGGSSCSNVLTGMTISYTIGTSGTSYVLSGVTISPTYSTVTYGSTVIVSLSVTVNSPVSSSGNPGYRLGKPITISPSIFTIGNPTTGTCYTSSTGSTLDLLFGQSATYSCVSPSPCSTSYYIDSLIQSTISIQKYASQSTDTITVIGTSSGTNGCKYESYNLQILYSYSGWSLDPQYYIVGASLSGQTSADNSNPSKKYLSVSWVYTDPQSISTPPSNFFYTYFSYLWTPLKQKFGLS